MQRDVHGLLRNLIAHPEPDYVSVMVYMGEVVEDQPRAEGGVRWTVAEGRNGRLLMARSLIEPSPILVSFWLPYKHGRVSAGTDLLNILVSHYPWNPSSCAQLCFHRKKLSSHLYRVRPKPEIKTSFDFCSRVGVERRPLKWIYWIFLESTFRQIGLRSGPKKTFLSSLMSPMSKLKDFLSFITLWGWTLIVTWIWR